ncbi:hypothetical protein [Terrarubrum flagellatum]|uniref:hypothetical protein n=1 Tax=Terrirubrum flagellatum TaxID=2895980 RepID=UPI0031452CB6
MRGATFLFALIGAAPAQVLTHKQLLPAIDAVVTRKLEQRAMLASCGRADAHVKDVLPAAWIDFRNTLVTLLWAADFPADFVRGVMARTDPVKLLEPPPATDAVCKDPRFIDISIALKPDGWSSDMRFMFRGLQLPSNIPIPTGAQWDRVKAVVAHEAPAQAKMLNCFYVLEPNLLPILMSDWARAVGDSRVMLESAGFARDEIAALLDPLAPELMLKPAADRDAARAACRKDEEWQQRQAMFLTMKLFFDVKEIVTGKKQ